MINQEKPLPVLGDIAEHIRLARRVLNCSFMAIPELFPDRAVCVIDYLNKEARDKAIEVQFESATLTCLFDGEGVCDSTFLYLDDLSDLQGYIACYNDLYNYDFMLKAWVVDTIYYIKLEMEEDEPFFALLPLSDRK